MLSIASAKCPCGTDTLDRYVVSTIDDLQPQNFGVLLNTIDSQFICRKKLGIVRYCCSDQHFLMVNEKNVDSLSQNEYLLLLSYRKRCYQFQKELNFPINLENDTTLLNLSKIENPSMRENAYLSFFNAAK